MPVDSQIPLEAGNIQGTQPNALMSILSFATQFKQQQQEVAKKNALLQIFSDPNSVDAQTGTTTPQATRKVLAIDPQLGLKMQDDAMEAQVKRAQIKHYATDAGKVNFDFMSSTAGIGYDAYDAAKKAGKSEQEALAAGQSARNEAVKNNGGIISNDVADGILSKPFVPAGARALAGANKEWSAQRHQQDSEETANKRLDLEGKRTDALIAQGNERLSQGQDRISQNANSFTPEMGSLMAALAEHGVSVPAGFRSKAQQAALYKSLLERNPEKSPDEIANLVKTGQIEFGAQKKETQTAAGIAGKVEVAGNELKQFVPLVRKASADLQRSNIKSLNELVQKADSQISDPKLKTLKGYIVGTLNAYDVLAARGGTDKEKRAENREQLLSAEGDKAINAALDVIMKESEIAHGASVEATRVPELEGPASAKASGNVASPTSKTEYDALPKGTFYSKPGDPPGTHRVKQ